MMYPAGGIKPGCVHIPAFTADGSAIRFASVIARLDRATQYAAASVIEPKSRGVLDPAFAGMTSSLRRREQRAVTPSSSRP
jgi:hypothetical protein